MPDKALVTKKALPGFEAAEEKPSFPVALQITCREMFRNPELRSETSFSKRVSLPVPFSLLLHKAWPVLSFCRSVRCCFLQSVYVQC